VLLCVVFNDHVPPFVGFTCRPEFVAHRLAFCAFVLTSFVMYRRVTFKSKESQRG
jgi:putative flippase GtrA